MKDKYWPYIIIIIMILVAFAMGDVTQALDWLSLLFTHT